MTSGHVSDDATRIAIRGELDRNIFVEAGAGTGKTTSLVSRLMALIESGVGVDQIVAITFTRSAAAELRVRIRQGLEELVRAGNASEVVQQALANVDSAAFRTIDSHVQSLLREYPIEAGLPPSVEIQSRTEEIESFAEQWSDWVNELLDADADFVETLGLAMSLGMSNPLRDMRGLAELINANHGLLGPVEVSGVDADAAREAVKEVVSIVGKLRDDLRYCDDPGDRLYLYLQERVDWWEAVEADALESEDEAIELLANSPEMSKKRIGATGNWRRDIREVRNRIEFAGEKLAEPLDGLRRQVGDRLFNYALRFVTDSLVSERVSDGRLTFHDGMVFAVRLLRDNASVRRAVQAKHTHVLVDEFQDTDLMQVELVELLTIPVDGGHYRPGSLFCVGDPKQSIYRFRGADVEVSSAVMGRIDASESGLALSLTENHRSSVSVIEWVNAVFGRWMSSELDDAQARWSALVPDARAHESAVQGEVYYIGDDLGHGSAPAGAVWEASDITNVALAAAHGKFQVRDRDGSVRRSRAGDMVIITPRRNRWNRYIDELESAGIGCVAERDDEFFKSQMVRDVINCLNAIDDPTNQVATLGALRSHWFACSDRDFLDWVHAGGRLEYSDEGCPTDVEGSPVADAFVALRKYHSDRAKRMPSELLERLVRERQVRELCILRDDAPAVLATLDAVLEMVRGFESDGTGTLRECVRKLEAMRDAGESLRLVPTRASETDKVRLMTIHQSKGLEFPIVVVADTDDKPRRDRSDLLLSPGVRSGDGGDTNGFAARLGSGGRYFRVGNYEEVADLGKAADTLQMTRLYYVAATRAKDVLVVSKHHKRTAQPPSKPAALMSEHAAKTDGIWKPIPVEWSSLPRIESSEPTSDADSDPIDVEGWERDFLSVVTDARSSDIVSPSSLHGDDHEGTSQSGKSAQADPLDADSRPGRGRASTDIGRAVHAGLQQLIDAGEWDENAVVHAARFQAGEHGVGQYGEEIRELIAATMRVPLIQRVASLPPDKRWVEVSVAGASRDDSGTIYDGQIDLLYEVSPGRFAVVDFKTDREFGREIEEMARPYESQLRAYAEVVESATGCAVVEGVLVFSRLAADDPGRAVHSWTF